MAKGETYEEFVAKFLPKKTTDDCYTPRECFEAIKSYVCERFNVDPKTVICPFYPGGDYERENYEGRVVIDNPPFSILSEIIRFYGERGIPFFLYKNGLTLQKEALKHHVLITGGTLSLRMGRMFLLTL